MEFPYGRPGRFAGGIALAVAIIIAVLSSNCSASYKYSLSPEAKMLTEIESHSRNFQKKLERILFREGYFKVSQRETLERLTLWLRENEYSRIEEFLDVLTYEDIEMLFDLFKDDIKISSTEYCPVIMPPERMNGQRTILSFPFEGEYFVAQGNGGWVSHFAGSDGEFAWDFVVMKQGSMSGGNAGKNENYYSWGLPVLSPADGQVVRTRTGEEDHSPMTVITKDHKSNYVVIEHEKGEFSNIHHLMKDSITVSPGDYVKRGQIIGRIGDTGISMFPHIHFQLDTGVPEDRRSVKSFFPCYFARHKSSLEWKLVVAGAPANGEYVISVDDFLMALTGI